jgi:hypothetical protein
MKTNNWQKQWPWHPCLWQMKSASPAILLIVRALPGKAIRADGSQVLPKRKQNAGGDGKMGRKEEVKKAIVRA